MVALLEMNSNGSGSKHGDGEEVIAVPQVKDDDSLEQSGRK